MPEAKAKQAIKVPLLDLTSQYKPLREEIRAAIDEICDSQQFILGPPVAALEQEVADYCGVDFGIGVSSGTDALLLALMALGIGYNDEVITPPYTFFATSGAIARLGARSMFCDIEPATYNLSVDAVQSLIETKCVYRDGKLHNKKTGGQVKALMVVHLYGQLANMQPLLDLAKQYELAVVEDAAQAIGSADSNGARAGSFGDVGCFSFFPSKNLGAFGDAGMCVAKDEALAERMRVLRVHGGQPKYYHKFIGANFRIDALQAAVIRIKLKHLDDWTAARQRNAEIYNQAFAAAGLGEMIAVPYKTPGYRHIYNQYIVRVRQRDKLRDFLTQNNIGSEIYYPVPLHLQECFADLGYNKGDFPQSEQAALETLALPIYPELTEQQLCYVVETISAFYH